VDEIMSALVRTGAPMVHNTTKTDNVRWHDDKVGKDSSFRACIHVEHMFKPLRPCKACQMKNVTCHIAVTCDFRLLPAAEPTPTIATCRALY
jgi:hypothetical protein